jgi:hypothetical protein
LSYRILKGKESFVKKIGDEAVEKALKAVKRIMRKDGVSSDKIQTYLNVLGDAK